MIVRYGPPRYGHKIDWKLVVMWIFFGLVSLAFWAALLFLAGLLVGWW